LIPYGLSVRKTPAISKFIIRTGGSGGGLPIEAFDQIRAGVVADRSQFWKDLSLPFYGYKRQGARQPWAAMN
jgi:non-heme chloroperoxidase